MAGRPEGSLKSPELSYQYELRSWISVATRIRGMIGVQLDMFEQRIKDTAANKSFSTDEQLKIMAGLADILETAIKTSEAGIKAKTSDDNSTSSNPEDIKALLTGGKGG